MTPEELEIAKAACCVGTIWDHYEGTENFNEMVGKRVQHLIELVRNHLQHEQPKMDLQAEQKPVEPSDDELQRHQDELYAFKVFATKQAREHHISLFVHDFEWNNFCEGLLSYFNEKQKPKKWSKEDEKIRKEIATFLKEGTPYFSPNSIIRQKWAAWVNRLQPHWKPSEEQMTILEIACKYEGIFTQGQISILLDLKEQLEKL